MHIHADEKENNLFFPVSRKKVTFVKETLTGSFSSVALFHSFEEIEKQKNKIRRFLLHSLSAEVYSLKSERP